MKRVRRGLVAATAGVVVVGVAVAATAALKRTDRSDLQERLDAVVAAGAVGALAEVRDERGVWRSTGGVADRDKPRPVPVDGRFRVGSTTKTFVSTVVLQLVHEGRLKLDDPVEAWLPGVVPGGHGITVRHLLNKTSGLYDFVQMLPMPPVAGGRDHDCPAVDDGGGQLLHVAAPSGATGARSAAPSIRGPTRAGWPAPARCQVAPVVGRYRARRAGRTRLAPVTRSAAHRRGRVAGGRAHRDAPPRQPPAPATRRRGPWPDPTVPPEGRRRGSAPAPAACPGTTFGSRSALSIVASERKRAQKPGSADSRGENTFNAATRSP